MASERVQRRIERLLDQAEEAMDRLDGDSVHDVVKVVLGLDPENSDALVFLASVEQVLEKESATPPAQTTTAPPVPHVDQPSSFADGRYQVKRLECPYCEQYQSFGYWVAALMRRNCNSR